MSSFKELFEQDKTRGRNGFPAEIISETLLNEILKRIPQKGNVLFSEGELILPYLDEILNQFPSTKFEVCFMNDSIYKKAKQINNQNKLIISKGSSEPLKTNKTYDAIFTIPPIGIRGNYRAMGYSSNDFCISQIEELLNQMSNEGKIIAITAQGIATQAQAKEFRENIIKNYKLVQVDSLPPKMLKATIIKTVMMEITKGKTDSVVLNEFMTKENNLYVYNSINKTAKELIENDSLDITKYMILDDEDMKKYKSSSCIKYSLEKFFIEKCKYKNLKDVIFRGKSSLNYLENDEITTNKDIAYVINIADIQDSSVNFDNLKAVKSERSNSNYLLEDYDILLTSRGTDIRTCIFENPDNNKYLASANIIVIRFKEEKMAKYMQIFFESEIGKKTLESLKSGTIMANIIPEDVKKIVIPILPQKETEDLIARYDGAIKELNIVKEKARQMVETEEINLQNFYISFKSAITK